MDLYAENILDHYRDPRNRGAGKVGSITGKEDNPSCGDALTLHLWIDNGILKKIEWEGTGCAISQAAMSMLSEEITGKSVPAILKLKKDDVYTLLGVPIGPRRYKCALLGLHALKNTLRKYAGKEPQSWLKTVEVE